MKYFLLTLVAAGALCGAAAAATIDTSADEANLFDFGIMSLDPIGQSFQAEDPVVDISFNIAAINPHLPSASITSELLLGEGFGGPTIETVTVDPPLGTKGLFQFFDNVSLDVGSQYTARLTTSTEHWGVRAHFNTNPYANGRAYHADIGTVVDNGESDLVFRVEPIPLPATLPLVLGALGLTLAAARRRG